jgi:hypothetical protein
MPCSDRGSRIHSVSALRASPRREDFRTRFPISSWCFRSRGRCEDSRGPPGSGWSARCGRSAKGSWSCTSRSESGSWGATTGRQSRGTACGTLTALRRGCGDRSRRFHLGVFAVSPDEQALVHVDDEGPEVSGDLQALTRLREEISRNQVGGRDGKQDLIKAISYNIANWDDCVTVCPNRGKMVLRA